MTTDLTLTESQRANLNRVRISPVMVRSATHRAVRPGPGDMRVLRGLAARGLVEIKPTMSGPAFHITEAGREALS